MAFSTSTVARWTILSSSTGTPSGRCRPSAFGMYARRTGFARYAPRCSRSERSWRFALQRLLRSAATSRHRRPERRPSSARGTPSASVVDVAHVVQQRGEPHLPIPSCCLPYRSSALGASVPALSPGRVLLARISFGPAPFPPRPPRPVARRCSVASSGTTRLSDFLEPFIIGVRRSTSRRGPRVHLPRATLGSPGSRAWCFRACTGSLTARGPARLALATHPVWPSASPDSVGTLE